MVSKVTFYNSIKAEIQKTRNTPILWISIGSAMFLALFVFLSFALDTRDQVMHIGNNPWERYIRMSMHLMAIFILPIVILLASSIAQTEHRNNMWKQLYSLPVQRQTIFLSKLLLQLLAISSFFIVFMFLGLIGGYILGRIEPLYEFSYYGPALLLWLSALSRTFLAALGILAFQYWISVRWQNFIIPIGIGLVGFILMLVMMNNSPWIVYVPFGYPSLILLRYGFNADVTGLEQIAFLYNVEWYSLLCFLVFTGLGLWEEKRKEIIH
jgi:hypothetical protein